MGESTRYESMSAAHRLAAVAELFARLESPVAELEWHFVDHCAVVAAEVSAAQNISHHRAVSQVQFACNLFHRLPRVAKVFCRGTIDMRVVKMIVDRTENVEDEVIAELDEAIARRCEHWMRLSEPKLRDRVDKFVADFDPAAVRVPKAVDEQRHVEVEPSRTDAGMAVISGAVHAADGAALNARLDALADTVCEHDPRDRRQRRADACGPLARMEATLPCQCGREDCPATAQRKAAEAAVIHVLAEQATVEGTGDAPGYLEGFGILPAESVRALVPAARLSVVEVPAAPAPPPPWGSPAAHTYPRMITAADDAQPAPAAPADPGYRPSARTREFLRWRDVTCRFPGCDRPVADCDVDHTVAYPAGPTHPSNTKHYCRIHHLIKTFHTGPTGWRDQQMADGTIVLHSPTGHTYCEDAHGAALFSALGTSTGELDLPYDPYGPAPDPDRLAKMPRRKRTREQARRQRINAERQQRIELNAEAERQHNAWLAATYEPPPF